MSALVLVAFLACAGARCEAVELPWDGSLADCRAHAQFVLARWAGEHPGHAIRRWRCEMGQRA